MAADSRGPILVVGAEPGTAARIVFELRRLGRSAVWLDTCESALETIDAVAFALVIATIEHAAEWSTFGALAKAAHCPVVVASRFLASDRRYRIRAFRAGAAAYMCPPYDRNRLRQLLTKVGAGETRVELVDGARHSEASETTSTSLR